MQRELAQWDDAFAFDDEFGADGPDAIGKHIERLRAAGRMEETNWWIDVGAKLVRLYQIRADAAH